ncbi:MAG: 23S rRNA (uracil(1939)-C(5))-methyltransferase RlmD, partial [Bacillota bacterium]
MKGGMKGGGPVVPGDRIELTLHGLAAEGDAVGRYEGMAVFVPLGAPGDRVRARVVEVKPRYARAELEEILEPGPGRTGAACPLFGACGGCQLQHLAYEAQLAWKRQQVIDALTRIGKLERPLVLPTLAMERPWYYRNKAAVPVRRRPGGRVELGFFARGTHEPVDFGPAGCAIQHPVINRVVAAVREWLEETPAGRATPIYDEATHSGLLRHVVARVGLKTGEALAGLVINGDALPAEEELAAFLGRRVPELVGVVKNINRRRGNTILGEETVPIAGRPWLVDELGGLRFRVSLASFYQVNPVQAERLYQWALDEALGAGTARGMPASPGRPGNGPAGGSRGGGGPGVIDAYAGIGTPGFRAGAPPGPGP